MMEKKRDRKRLARICVLAAAITLGSAWHVSGAQAEYHPPGSISTENQEAEADTGKSQHSWISEMADEQNPEITFIYQSLEDGTIEIIGFNGEQTGDLVIPNEIDGKIVTSIGDSAFDGCSGFTGGLKLPESLTKIGYSAFFGCNRLASVSIPGSVRNIGSAAFQDCDGLTSVSITEGVEGIWDRAFYDCDRLASVSIPGSVRSIESDAFQDCDSLASVSISEGVVSIWDSVFENCDSLASVSIPGSVESIEDRAFYDCDSLVSVSISEGVESIGEYVFYGCSSLTAIEVASGNQQYSSEHGILFSKTGEELLQYPAGKKEETYEIPGSVKTIGRYAFSDCDSLVSVSIPGSVESIGDSVFSGCSSLTAIEVADGNQWYSSENGILFSKTGERLLAYPAGKKEETYEVPRSVESIEDSAFYDCDGLTSVSIPYVMSIGYSAFYDCDSLASVSIPGSVISTGHNAFSSCDSLASVSISEGVERIEDSTFSDCDSLVSVSIPGSVRSIEYQAFYDCDGLTSVSMTEGVENIGWSAFSDCDSLVSVNIPGSVRDIGDSSFGNCDSLASVSMTEGVENIGRYAFSDCDSLVSVNIPGSVRSIGESSFRNCDSLASVSMTEGVENIGWSAFYDCDSLVSVSIPGSVESIGYSVFSGCSSLTAIEVADGNQWYSSENGILFSKTGEELLAYPAGKKEETYEIPGSVKSIGYSAFSDCDSLVSVSMTEGVKSIGGYAFSDCDSLASVSIPGSVMSIGWYAFSYCDSLRSVTIPKSVTDIEKDVFLDCPLLTIYCYRDSAAEVYAKENKISYEYIDESGGTNPPSTETPGGNTNPQGSTGNDKTPGKPDSGDTNTQTPGKPDSGKQPGDSSDAGTKNPQTIKAKDITKTYGARAFSLGAKASGGGKLSYTVSDKKVAAVSNKGIVTIKGCGVTEITIKAAETGTYAAAEKTITLTVKAKKQTITAKDLTKTYGAKAFSLGAKASGGGKLTYTVSDRKVAAVSKAGKVTIKGCGVTKIKISAAASKNHAAATKTITLTVKPKQQKISSLKSQKAKTLTVKWKKDAKATGYILQYSTDKKFKKAVKTVTIKKNGTTAKTVSKLKGGKKYYVRVCSYKTSGGKPVKGAYSPAKAVTVKK